MKNRELNILSVVVGQVAQIKVYGTLKFKIAKLFKEIEAEMEPLRLAVHGLDPESKEYQEILEVNNDVEFKTKLTFDELEQLELSAAQLIVLEHVTEEVLADDKN